MHKDFPAIAMKVMTDTLSQFPLPAFISRSDLQAVCEKEDSKGLYGVIGNTMDVLESMDYLYVTYRGETETWITRLTEKGLHFFYGGDTPLNALLLSSFLRKTRERTEQERKG